VWRALLVATVNDELARAEGLKAARAELILMLTLALLVALAIKVVGVLLITALLIVPAAAARRFAATPESMAVGAAVVGCLAVVGGLAASLAWDTPAGPSIVVAALAVFVAVQGVGLLAPIRSR
ncbi:MAG: metal ABC transporter permease, partial [Kiloniellales bacterium]